MSGNDNIFADEWNECLRAHYMHVIRTNDKVTLPSLTIVMQQAGFSTSQLAELRVRATMHVDEAPANFVPDLDELNHTDGREHAEPQVFPVPDLPAQSESVAAEPSPDLQVLESMIEVEAKLPVEEPLFEVHALDAVVEVESELPNEDLEEELLAGEIDEEELEDQEEDPDAPQQLTLF